MRAVLAVLILAFALPVAAVQPDEILDDPALESRAREISKELRCLVCRNESIDDSRAGLARDLRLLVRERLVEGDTDAEVKDFLVDRFGEFVLLKPVFNLQNAMLWFSGPVLFLAGLGAAVAFMRARRPVEAVGGLSPEEQAELDRILKD